MKNVINLKPILGLTQEEIAMLLGVTRVQWAHYTVGRRDLPLAAKIKLTDVLSSVQQKKTSGNEKAHHIMDAENKKAQDWLQQEFKAIPFKELELDKKINKILEIRADAFKALEVAHYIESQKEVHPIETLAEFIQIRAKNTLKKHNLQQVQELQLKKESLQMLKLQLEKKMNNLRI
jgi:predicted transcriptional regulator